MGKTRRHVLLMAIAVAWLAAAPLAAQPPAPELVFEQLGTDDGALARLGPIDEDQLRRIGELVGLDAPGEPIRVVLASEDTGVAQQTPAWIAGFAHGAADTVVLFPSRSLRYPHDSLQAVLHHEVAHILIGRAAGDGHVPRWFNEGLATVAERAWHFEDRRRLAWTLLAGGPPGMDEVDARFALGGTEAANAYAVASAFVRDLIDAHGPELPAHILGALARGDTFDEAFRGATGQPLHVAEREFHGRLRAWERWVPLLTSPFALWMFVTLLALYAIHVRQRRRAERHRRWAEEEADEGTVTAEAGADAWAAPDPLGWQPSAPDPDDERRGGPH